MRKYRWALLGILFLTACADSPESRRVQLVQENTPAVVAVNVLKKDGSVFTGTGFVVTPDGLIATNRHVIDQAVYINTTFSDGTVSGEAKPVASATHTDLALIKINARHLPTVRLASSARVLPGQSITVIGNPRRLQNTVSTGIISQVRQKADGGMWHQISAPISPSSSGSPVFNEQGEVISVSFASYKGEDNQNLNFAIPSGELIRFVRAAGYTLPAPVKKTRFSSNPLVRHVQKSWAIVKSFFTAH